MKSKKVCCLTLDWENDCGGRVGLQFDTISKSNIAQLIQFIQEQDVPLTIFAAGKAIEARPEPLQMVREQLPQTEFGLHSHTHTNGLNDYREEIRQGTAAYVQFFNESPRGYRGPQGKVNPVDLDFLCEHGFAYDASVFPTVRPGLFNNLDAPGKPYWIRAQKLVEIPGTVLPLAKIPYGLGYFRLLGPLVTKQLLRFLKHPDFLVLNFHLHDVFLSEHREQLKGFWHYFYHKNVTNGFNILAFAIQTLKKQGYEFVLMNAVCEDFQQKENTNPIRRSAEPVASSSPQATDLA